MPFTRRNWCCSWRGQHHKSQDVVDRTQRQRAAIAGTAFYLIVVCMSQTP